MIHWVARIIENMRIERARTAGSISGHVMPIAIIAPAHVCGPTMVKVKRRKMSVGGWTTRDTFKDLYASTGSSGTLNSTAGLWSNTWQDACQAVKMCTTLTATRLTIVSKILWSFRMENIQSSRIKIAQVSEEINSTSQTPNTNGEQHGYGRCTKCGSWDPAKAKLYEALEEFVKICDCNNHDADFFDAIDCCLHEARQSLKKARGEE